MTVKQMLRLKNVILLIGLLGVLALALYLNNMWSLISIMLYCLLWYVLQQYLIKFAFNRLSYITTDLLDPFLLEAETNCFMKLVSYQQMYMKYMADADLLYIKGQFVEALDIVESFHYKRPQDKRAHASVLFTYRIRAGKIDMATALLNDVESMLNEYSFNQYLPNLQHKLGLYHLETGDLGKAREFLESSFPSSKANNINLAIRYDLARLEEKEGNRDKAAEHYKQAAALGPKTWMGQESARRLDALN